MAKYTAQQWTRFTVTAALIAAAYVLLVLIFPGFAFGPVQLRVAEALCVLPALTPAGIPGLIVGCLISNIIGGNFADVIFGTLATGLAAVLTYALRRHKYLIPLPAVLINAVVVGLVIGITTQTVMTIPLTMLSILVGQLVACYWMGLPLYEALKRLPIFRKGDNQ